MHVTVELHFLLDCGKLCIRNPSIWHPTMHRGNRTEIATRRLGMRLKSGVIHLMEQLRTNGDILALRADDFREFNNKSQPIVN